MDKKIKNILWDFDGVILDSMEVRDLGFKEIFKNFKVSQVNRLLRYHRENGGLSRYVKIRYFHEKILDKSIEDSELNTYANHFSKIMLEKLVNPNYLISDTIEFIKKNHQKYNMHIVSGSDQKELRFICQELDIEDFFISINGSPVHKNDLVKHIMSKYAYNVEDTCLIGDSINDYNAAKGNLISFLAYNNESLNNLSDIKPLY